MTPRVPSNFTSWLIGIGELKVGQTWVLARRTPRMLERYPPGTRFFGKKEYDGLEERYRLAKRDDALMAIVRQYELPIATQHTELLAQMLAAAFEAGRKS